MKIVVPYRNREEHLKIFAPYLKNNYGADIYVIEQIGNEPFNRGKLLNVGFDLIKNDCDYFITHDIDMLPISVDYSKGDSPLHIATMCSQFNYKMPYPDYFGGVNIFNVDDFKEINGFANHFWGWGAEDDELRLRFERKGFKIERRECKFESLHHERKIDKGQYRENLNRYRLAQKGVLKPTSGLSDLIYDLRSVEVTENYTKFAVKI